MDEGLNPPNGKVTKCPVCNERYDRSRVFALNRQERNSDFHLTCGKCKTAVLLRVVSEQFGMMSIGAVTDLNRIEAQSLLNERAISSDEVLDAYECLTREEKRENDAA